MATRPVPTSDWIRPFYFYTLCLLANLVMLFGGVQVVLGLVNTVVPRTDSSPITQIVNAVIDVVQDPNALPSGQAGSTARQGIDAVKNANNKQARSRGITRMITGIVIFAAGTLTFAMARRQAEREESRGGGRGPQAASSAGPPMAGYPPAGPQGGYGQPGSSPGGYAPPSYPQPGAE